MSEWTLAGYDRKATFERELSPNILQHKLKQYQAVLGKEFGIRELLELEKLRGMALIAEAINDLPEFLVHQFGKEGQLGLTDAVTGGMEAIADAIYVACK